jgi:hypothetical protein
MTTPDARPWRSSNQSRAVSSKGCQSRKGTLSMATTEEIQRRVAEADTARSAKRSAAARQVDELAQRRAAIAEQLEDLERQLGDILAAAREVMEIDELARFTDLPAADLTRWLEARKTARTKRKKPAAGAGAKRDISRRPSAAPSAVKTPSADRASALPAAHRDGTADTPAHVPAEMN